MLLLNTQMLGWTIAKDRGFRTLSWAYWTIFMISSTGCFLEYTSSLPRMMMGANRLSAVE